MPVLKTVPRSKVARHPCNPRKSVDPEGKRKLTASMKQHGILSPLGVVPDGDRYLALWGSTRLECAEEAGIELVSVIVLDEPMSESGYLLRALADNIARSDLKPFEVTEQFEALAAAEPTWTDATIAEMTDYSPAMVSQCRRIRAAHESVWAAFKAELLTVPVAYDLARLPLDQQADALQLQLAKPKTRKGRKPATEPTERVNRLRAPLAGGTVTLAGKNLDLRAAIALVNSLLSELKAAHDQNLSITTVGAMFADRAGKAAGHV